MSRVILKPPRRIEAISQSLLRPASALGKARIIGQLRIIGRIAPSATIADFSRLSQPLRRSGFNFRVNN
jgi:hypothetical protein